MSNVYPFPRALPEATPHYRNAPDQETFETFTVAGSIVLGTALGYRVADRLYEGRTPSGKAIEYGLKASGMLVGSVLGLTSGLAAVMAKEKAVEVRGKVQDKMSDLVLAV